jgi:hypothetical protein
LTPQPDYWYDLNAIREPHATAKHHEKYHSNGIERPKLEHSDEADGVQNTGLHPSGKNPGDVFEVTTKPYPDAHFAVYPPELCETPIQATCPPKVCAACGAPYERDVDRTPGEYAYSDRSDNMDGDNAQLQASGAQLSRPSATMDGWIKPCDCDTEDTNAGIALDPFAGAGTTCLVAKNHGRRFVGLELNPEYVALAQSRLGLTVADPQFIRDEDATGLDTFTTPDTDPTTQ